MSEYHLRSKTTRGTRNRHTTSFRPTPKASEIFPGLNDITDAFEALPTDVIRYFTLLKEIDAKCVNIIPSLNYVIKNFVKTKNDPSNKEARTAKIREISSLIRDILPCLEEKMHVATIAADKTINYIDRINDDFDLIFRNEIPEHIKVGTANHPAVINDSRIPDNKSAQSQRSESRREALAARKAANDTDNDESGTNKSKGRRAEKESTPSGLQPPTTTTTKKRKANNATTNNNNNNTSNNTGQNQGANAQAQSSNATKNEEPQISRPSTPSTNKRRQTSKKKPTQTTSNQPSSQSAETAKNVASAEAEYADEIASRRNNADEPLYCYCNQVSYGEMVGCDGDDCKREWFHLPCTGLATLPKGKWYCDDCSAKLKKAKKI